MLLISGALSIPSAILFLFEWRRGIDSSLPWEEALLLIVEGEMLVVMSFLLVEGSGGIISLCVTYAVYYHALLH